MEVKLASPRFLLLATACLIILGGLVPILLSLAWFQGLRMLTPEKAIALLEDGSIPSVLVDVRGTAAFDERHVQGAINLPLESVIGIHRQNELPATLQGKTLVLICEGGFDSAKAARHLKIVGQDVYTVRGGMQEWGRDGPRLDNQRGSVIQELQPDNRRFIVDALGRAGLPDRALTKVEQAATAASLLVVKPFYMALSLLLGYLLLSNQDLDLRLAGWGVLFFWLGEVACAINIIFLKDDSYLAEYLHSYGMVLAFGTITYAIFETLDRRMIHFSAPEKRCTFVGLCGLCIKNQADKLIIPHCGLRRLMLLLLPVGALLAFVPLYAPLSLAAYNTNIGPLIHYFIRSVTQQLYETRYSPLAAIALFSLAWITVIFSRRMLIHPLARLLACSGVGFLSFSYFRTVLGLVYKDNLPIAMFWEEVTELAFILAALHILRVFHRTFLHGVRLPI